MLYQVVDVIIGFSCIFEENIMLRNRLTYGAVVLVLFIFIFLHDASMTYVAFYAALILPVISFIMGYFSEMMVSVSEALTHEFVTKNEVTEYKVRIHNSGFLPCFFAYIHVESERIGLKADVSEIYFAIKPFSSFETTIKLSGKYRGVYEMDVIKLNTYDFLGIFKFKAKYKSALKLTIAPQIIHIPALSSEITQQGETIIKRHIRGKDHSISAELRAYQQTDSYKQIHWKATAKKNELISKNPQEIEQLASVFFVDNLRIPKPIDIMLAQEDKMMDTVVSVMNHTNQLGHRMILQSLTQKNQEFTNDFTKLYHDVALLPFGYFGKIHHVLNEYLSTGNMLENILLFTQAIDENLLNSLQNFRFLGSNVTVFLFGTATKGQLRKLEALDIHYVLPE